MERTFRGAEREKEKDKDKPKAKAKPKPKAKAKATESEWTPASLSQKAQCDFQEILVSSERYQQAMDSKANPIFVKMLESCHLSVFPPLALTAPPSPRSCLRFHLFNPKVTDIGWILFRFQSLLLSSGEIKEQAEKLAGKFGSFLLVRDNPTAKAAQAQAQAQAKAKAQEAGQQQGEDADEDIDGDTEFREGEEDDDDTDEKAKDPTFWKKFVGSAPLISNCKFQSWSPRMTETLGFWKVGMMSLMYRHDRLFPDTEEQATRIPGLSEQQKTAFQFLTKWTMLSLYPKEEHIPNDVTPPHAVVRFQVFLSGGERFIPNLKQVSSLLLGSWCECLTQTNSEVVYRPKFVFYSPLLSSQIAIESRFTDPNLALKKMIQGGSKRRKQLEEQETEEGDEDEDSGSEDDDHDDDDDDDEEEEEDEDEDEGEGEDGDQGEKGGDGEGEQNKTKERKKEKEKEKEKVKVKINLQDLKKEKQRRQMQLPPTSGSSSISSSTSSSSPSSSASASKASGKSEKGRTRTPPSSSSSLSSSLSSSTPSVGSSSSTYTSPSSLSALFSKILQT